MANISENFMDDMTDEQKKVFLKALLFACKADGKVDEKEVRYIKRTADKYKIDDIKKIFEPITEDQFFEELSCFSERKWALELIKGIFKISLSDYDLSDSELDFIYRIGHKLGIDSTKIEEINNWVLDYIVWQEQGKIIFEENN